MIIDVKQPGFFLNKNDPTKISYNNENDCNIWKFIIVSKYVDLPKPKEDEILYKYSTDRAYLLNELPLH